MHGRSDFPRQHADGRILQESFRHGARVFAAARRVRAARGAAVDRTRATPAGVAGARERSAAAALDDTAQEIIRSHAAGPAAVDAESLLRRLEYLSGDDRRMRVAFPIPVVA